MTNLFIGASGLLGRTIKNNISFDGPPSSELDITKQQTIINFLLKNYSSKKLDNVILSAAYTNSGSSNKEYSTVNSINIDGPRNLIKCINSYSLLTGYIPKIIYISSDYVFKGDRGNYSFDEATFPVPNNYYAYSKSVAEEIIKTYSKNMIIRTSFCDDKIWKYNKAFTDKYTSADKVSLIAPIIARSIFTSEEKIIHIGTDRKSVFELAFSINKDIEPTSRLTFPEIGIPYDTSLKINFK